MSFPIEQKGKIMERNGSLGRAGGMPANVNCAPDQHDAGNETDAGHRLDEVVLIIARLIGRRDGARG